jgi:hypothetical protein
LNSVVHLCPNCLPFMTLVHTFWPLELVSMQQFFTGMQN